MEIPMLENQVEKFYKDVQATAYNKVCKYARTKAELHQENTIFHYVMTAVTVTQVCSVDDN